jgi:hypothetical protein
MKLNIKLSQFPLKNSIIYKGNGHYFNDIQMIEFWIAPTWKKSKSKKPKSVLEIQGKEVLPSSNNEDLVEGKKDFKFSISISNNRDSILITINDAKSITFSADFSKDDAYHVAVYIIKNQTVSVSINGNPCTETEKVDFLQDFNLKIKNVVMGNSSKAIDEFEGGFAALRFWKTQLRLEKLKAIAQWSKTSSPTNENGFNDVENVTEKLLAYFDPKNNKLLFYNHNVKFVGLWTESASEIRSTPQKVDIESIKKEYHCVYKETRYISIVSDTDKKVHLITDEGEDLLLSGIENEEYLFENKNSSCKLKEINSVINTIVKGKTIKIVSKQIEITEVKKLSINEGKYNIPYSKPKSEESSKWGSQFGNFLPNYQQFYQGIDITEVDPLDAREMGFKSSRIFRPPANEGHDFTVDKGFAVPFGINFTPNSSFNSTLTSTFISSKSTLEESSEKSTSVKKDIGVGYEGSASLPDVIGLSYKIDLGFKSGLNTKCYNKVQDIKESQSFYSFKKWESSDHDLILEKHKILFDGQIVPEDSEEDIEDLSGSFYVELLLLKESNDEEDYKNFINKFGTHFALSAQFGAIGGQIDTFDESVSSHLVESGSTLGHTSGFSFKGEAKGSVLGMFEGGPHGSYDEEKTDENGNNVSDSLESILKTQKTETWAVGTSSAEGTPSPSGPIVYKRHLAPISDLLLPPFIDDYEIISNVRPKLKDAIKDYITSVGKKNGEISYDGPSFYNCYVMPTDFAGLVYNSPKFEKIKIDTIIKFNNIPRAKKSVLIDRAGNLALLNNPMFLINFTMLKKFIEDGKINVPHKIRKTDFFSKLIDSFAIPGEKIVEAKEEKKVENYFDKNYNQLIKQFLKMSGIYMNATSSTISLEVKAELKGVISYGICKSVDLVVKEGDGNALLHTWDYSEFTKIFKKAKMSGDTLLKLSLRWLIVDTYTDKTNNIDEKLEFSTEWEEVDLKPFALEYSGKKNRSMVIQKTLSGLPIKIFFDKKQFSSLLID